jgi:hypothetical protein
MTKVKETRSLKISNKIFTSEDIRSLSLLFKTQINEILDEAKKEKRIELQGKTLDETYIEESVNNMGYIQVELISSDGSKFAGKIEDILEAEDFLNSNKLQEIRFIFVENTSSSMILIDLEHSLSNSGYVKIEGYNRTWVNGTSKKLDDFFKNCKDQSTFIRKNGSLVIVIIGVLLSVILMNLADFVLYKITSQENYGGELQSVYQWPYIIFFLGITFAIIIIPAVSIHERIEKLWPNIELQTGKDFHKIEKKKRERLKLLIIEILIPTLLSFLQFFFKKT